MGILELRYEIDCGLVMFGSVAVPSVCAGLYRKVHSILPPRTPT